VKVYSNAVEVELFQEGKSLGMKHSSSHVFTWPNTKLKAGENHFSATAHYATLEISDACTWLYEPATRTKVP